MKIGRPVVRRVISGGGLLFERLSDGGSPDRVGSEDGGAPTHPLELLRMAYGL